MMFYRQLQSAAVTEWGVDCQEFAAVIISFIFLLVHFRVRSLLCDMCLRLTTEISFVLEKNYLLKILDQLGCHCFALFFLIKLLSIIFFT